MGLTPYRHAANCTGCPHCDPALGALLRMTDREAAQFLKSRTPPRAARAGSRFVTVYSKGGSAMKRTEKATGRVYFTPPSEKRAASVRREPSPAERAVAAATHGATAPAAGVEVDLLRVAIRHAEGGDPYRLPDRAAQLREARAAVRAATPAGSTVPDPWKLHAAGAR